MRVQSLLLRGLTIVALLLSLTAPTSTRAAAPGEIIVSGSGSVANGNTLVVPIFESNDANLRMTVSGGAGTAALTFTLRRGTTPVTSWSVRTGETTWGYAAIAAGDKIEIQNASGGSLNYDLNVYARSILPAIGDGLSAWEGVAKGPGINSTAQFNVGTAGLYRFALNASSGSFQVLVDTNTILKTAVQGAAPDPNDSTYYLSAGTHTFRIIQNSSAATTAWSVALTQVGGLDTLPTTESSGVLGGGFFSEEWVPLMLEAGQAVNIRVNVAGATTNSLVVELYNDATKVFTSAPIFGGEIVWGSSQVTAGANALHISANAGNGAPLAYTVSISPIAPAPVPWTGTSYGAPGHPSGGNSTIQFTFAAGGIYRFNLSASASGRYQFLLASQYLQKTVSGAAPADFTAYVPAGTFPLTIVQDPAVGTTSWSAEISLVSESTDTLPYNRSGTALGGPGNAFGEEWLPIQDAGGRPVNIKVVATGAAGNSLQIELYNGATLGYSAATVYGGETFWATTQLLSGQNRLHIKANAGNNAAMGYTIEVTEIPTIPTAWDGVTLGAGLNSTITIESPARGAYTAVVTVSEGAGVIVVDPPTPGTSYARASSSTTLRIPLEAGPHTFIFQQDPGAPRTVWRVELSVRSLEYIVALPVVAN